MSRALDFDSMFPLCEKCFAFASEGGRKASEWAEVVPAEECGSIEEGDCLSEPAKPTGKVEFWRVIFDLTLDSGEVAPVDITGTLDTEARTFTLQRDFIQCQRRDGPPNKYVSRTYVDFVPTESEMERIEAKALEDFDAMDWEANRLANRRRKREEDDYHFQRGWDSYKEDW